MMIAVIDDDPLFQFVTKKMIARIAPGAEVLEFGNGQQALDFISSHRDTDLPEMILLDINMPVMNGWEFLEGLRSRTNHSYHPRIYLVSSSVDDQDALKATTYPELSSYLTKPLSQDQLIGILRTSS